MPLPRPALVLSLLALPFFASGVQADSLVFEIGTFNNSTADFEQESDSYNNPSYYFEAGDYTLTQGNFGFGENWAGPAPEILQDGADVATWNTTTDGFPRALTSGRPVVDIFFQLNAAAAASTSLLVETDLFGLGRNGFHDLTFYLNNVPFHREFNIRGNTSLQLYIPKNVPGMTFVNGSNVLSVRRTGGGKVDPDGFDEAWIQFDAIRLTAEVTSPTELIWQIGNFDNGQSEFEPEFSPHNNPQYYVAAGDYTSLRGRLSSGGEFAGPGQEILKDPEGDGSATPEGFPRALSIGRPIVEVYFQLTPAQAAKDYLSFKTVLMNMGRNSTHDIIAYLNGTPIDIGLGITSNTPVNVLIPRLGVRDEGMGPVFHEGNNVLSIVRTGGGPIDPLGFNEPYIQFDALSLETAVAPAEPDEVDAFQTLVMVGYINGSTTELEQESDAFNNSRFYAAEGDYALVQGKSSFGDAWFGNGPEIWQDGPEGTWATTSDGFPRAVIVSRPTIDIFFQAGSSAPSSPALLYSRLVGPGPGSTHDLEWSINGELVTSQTGVSEPSTDVMKLIPPGYLVEGANVLSIQRTGGVSPPTTWLSIDYVELITQFSEAAALPDFDITGISRAANNVVTLTWESEENAQYTIYATSNPEVSWDPIAMEVAGQPGTTNYEDTFIPANTTRRFYKVERTR